MHLQIWLRWLGCHFDSFERSCSVAQCPFSGNHFIIILLGCQKATLKKVEIGALNSKQGAKKVIFKACHSGKLKLAYTSPNVVSTSPQNVFMSRIDFTVLHQFEFLKNFTCPSGKLCLKFTSPISKSTGSRLSDTTFFARFKVKRLTWSWPGFYYTGYQQMFWLTIHLVT